MRKSSGRKQKIFKRAFHAVLNKTHIIFIYICTDGSAEEYDVLAREIETFVLPFEREKEKKMLIFIEKWK